MKKIKKVKEVVKKQEEVVAVEITFEEFAELASQECAKMFNELVSTGEPDPMDIMLPLICSDFAGKLAHKIFGNDTNEESEEENNG